MCIKNYTTGCNSVKFLRIFEDRFKGILFAILQKFCLYIFLHLLICREIYM